MNEYEYEYECSININIKCIGLWIHYRCWNNINHKKRIKGIIIISHGYGQHIHEYCHISKEFNNNNYIVYGIDHQGHGLSDGDRGYFKNLMDLVNDLIYFSDFIYNKHNKNNNNITNINNNNNVVDIPIYLFGHSMGGLVSMYAGLINQNNNNVNCKYKYKGIILSSPMLLPGKDEQINLTPFLTKIAIFIDKTFPKLPFIACYQKGLTNNKRMFYRHKQDRLKLYGRMPLRAGIIHVIY